MNLKPFKPRSRLSHTRLLLFALFFALAGGFLLYKSFALNPNLPGDVNNDNTVNITDLSILLSNYNQSYSPADFNSDGIVSILDLSILLSNYNKSYTPPPPPPPGGGGLPRYSSPLQAMTTITAAAHLPAEPWEERMRRLRLGIRLKWLMVSILARRLAAAKR